MKEKVVITGGAGFIGSHLSNRLLKEGFDVYVIDNLTSGKKHYLDKKIKFFNIDIRDLDAIKKIFIGAKYIFHLAALPSVPYSIENPIETMETNTIGTMNIFEASKNINVKKIINISSCSVYGDNKNIELKETNKIKPKSPYALHKFFGEEMSKLYSKIYNLNIVNLRLFNVYGPNQRKTGAYVFVIARFLDLNKKNKTLEITGDGKQKRDFVHVYDVVEAIIKTMNSKIKSGDVINIGSGKSYTINQIAKIVGGKIKYIEERLEPKNARANINKAIKLLKWRPKIKLTKGIEMLKKMD